MAHCIGRRPNKQICGRTLPPGNKAFCDRCSGENFKSKPKFKDQDELDMDKPNAYEPEPVEIPINEANPIRGFENESD